VLSALVNNITHTREDPPDRSIPIVGVVFALHSNVYLYLCLQLRMYLRLYGCRVRFLFCLIFNQHLHVGPIHTWLRWKSLSDDENALAIRNKNFKTKPKVIYRRILSAIIWWVWAVLLGGWVAFGARWLGTQKP